MALDFKKSLIDGIKELQRKDILRYDPNENILIELSDLKTHLCDFLISIIDYLNISSVNFPSVFIDRKFDFIQVNYKQIRENLILIDEIFESKNFTDNQRIEKINEIRNHFSGYYQDLQNSLGNIYTSYQIYDLSNKIESLNIDSMLNQIKDKYNQISTIHAEVEKIRDKLKDELFEKSVQKSKITFTELTGRYKKHQIIWGIFSFVFGFIFSISLYYLFFYIDINLLYNNKIDIIAFFIKRFVLLSTIIVFFKIALTRYNLERNLYIVYANRVAVLEQFNLYEQTVDDSFKNQLKIEIMKYVFSDPQTGYIKEQQVNELNVNPIIQLMDKFSQKAAM